MGNIRIRAGFRVAAGIAALALPLAAAGNAFADAPGDNGDVKIHDIAAHADVQDNDPHVCAFYLDAFNFDTLQKVHWEIDFWAGSDSDDSKGALAAQGDITLKNGYGQTAPITVPETQHTHYKLFWTFTGENGNAKHKTFWVDCGTPGGSSGDATTGGLIGGTVGGTVGGLIGGTTSGSTGGSSTGGSGSTGGGGSGGSTGGTTSGPTSHPSTSAAASTTAPAAPATTSPSTSSTGRLAHTGADGSALIYTAIGAAALAGGGYGLRRYAISRSKA